jgi:NTP pyrophosphatase (non-canonical NTP hydrolase)
MTDLLLSELRSANVARLPQFRDAKGRLSHPPIEGQPPGFDWALSKWSNAVCGELGEAANLIKKIERGDFELDEVRGELADELCDVLTYLDILAHRAGINLAEATIAKWNRVSVRVGSNVRIEGIDPAEV